MQYRAWLQPRCGTPQTRCGPHLSRIPASLRTSCASAAHTSLLLNICGHADALSVAHPSSSVPPPQPSSPYSLGLPRRPPHVRGLGRRLHRPRRPHLVLLRPVLRVGAAPLHRAAGALRRGAVDGGPQLPHRRQPRGTVFVCIVLTVEGVGTYWVGEGVSLRDWSGMGDLNSRRISGTVRWASGGKRLAVLCGQERRQQRRAMWLWGFLHAHDNCAAAGGRPKRECLASSRHVRHPYRRGARRDSHPSRPPPLRRWSSTPLTTTWWRCCGPTTNCTRSRRKARCCR